MFAAIENIQSLIGIEDYVIALTLDDDDDSVNNPEVKERLKKYDKLIVDWGLSESKIHSINRNIPTDIAWKLLLVVADDFVFIKQDFGKDILQAFEENPGAGLIHFPDGKQNEKLITLPLMTREYYELFGYVYNPAYENLWADNEQMAVAKKLGKYRYIPTHIARHEHPIWGYGVQDELSKKQDSPENYARDRKTFQERQAKNFYL